MRRVWRQTGTRSRRRDKTRESRENEADTERVRKKGRTRYQSPGSSSTNPHAATGYTNHRKARAMGYESTRTTPRTLLHLPQPTRPPTQCRTNARGSTGQWTPTRPSAQSPTRATFALQSPGLPWWAPYPHPAYLPTQSRPRNLFAHHPSTPSPRQSVMWHPARAPPTTNAPTTPHARTPVSPTKFPVPITAPPWVPAECAPTAVVQAPRDLSGLHSSTPNPWGSLSRHCPHSYPLRDLSVPRSDATNPRGNFCCHHYPGVPRQFAHQNWYPSRYPVNTHSHTNSDNTNHLTKKYQMRNIEPKNPHPPSPQVSE